MEVNLLGDMAGLFERGGEKLDIVGLLPFLSPHNNSVILIKLALLTEKLVRKRGFWRWASTNNAWQKSKVKVCGCRVNQ